MGIEAVRLIDFPKIADHRGNLTFIESARHVPFHVKRVFYIYDIPSGENRGAHAHKTLEQCLVCLSGGLDVHVDDGRVRRTIRLNRPWTGLYVPPLIWASEGNFDSGTVYLVLTSEYYTADDYIRDYDEFMRVVSRDGA